MPIAKEVGEMLSTSLLLPSMSALRAGCRLFVVQRIKNLVRALCVCVCRVSLEKDTVRYRYSIVKKIESIIITINLM